MLNDIRVYNYHDNEPLITRMTQAKKYFDDKFANIHADVDLTEVENKIDTVNTNVVNGNEEVKGVIIDSKEEIIEAMKIPSHAYVILRQRRTFVRLNVQSSRKLIQIKT